LDTPNDNWPINVPEGFPVVLFAIIEKISPMISDIILGDLCNMRLGTQGLNMAQIGYEVAKMNMTF
jgi:hypothetical protein